MPNLMQKHTQNLSREQLQTCLKVLRKEQPADLKLVNLQLLDLVNGEVIDGPLVICDGIILALGAEASALMAERVVDCQGRTAAPGFIDAHMHVESSTMTPFEFERTTLPLGTTTIVADPHELVNVCGKRAFEWFLRCSEQMKQNMFIQVSSCVPAVEGIDVNGSGFSLSEMQPYLTHPNVLGLAEVMDYVSVINGTDPMLDKLEAFNQLNIDGHCPQLTGLELSAYITSGIQNCHETVTYQEGKEKLSKGMSVIIREGSVAKNLDALAPLISEFSSTHCMLCTDDRNPYEIAREGHINYLVKRLIQKHDVPVHLAYRVASWSAANHFGLKRLGLLAPGYKADILLLNDLAEVDIDRVLIGGEFVDELALQQQVEEKLTRSEPPLEPSINRKELADSELDYPFQSGDYNVIKIVKNELITERKICRFQEGSFVEEGVNKIAVVERYGQQLPPAIALVEGFTISQGAIAASVGHDSHNLVVIGSDDQSMVNAINHLIELGGGFCVVQNGEVLADLKLPVGGLMSCESSEQITQHLAKLKQAAKSIGVKLDEPFIQMSFLALPVIPSLKMTAKGLFDVEEFDFISLQCN